MCSPILHLFQLVNDALCDDASDSACFGVDTDGPEIETSSFFVNDKSVQVNFNCIEDDVKSSKVHETSRSIGTQYNRIDAGLPGIEKKDNGTSMGKFIPKLSRSSCVSVEFKPFEIASVSELDTSMDTSIDTLVDDIEEDPDFVPAEEDMPVKEDFVITESTSNEILSANESPCLDYKFIIFWSKLLLLFKFCFRCGAHACITSTTIIGTHLVVKLLCSNGHEPRWESQPLINGTAAGNLLLAACILFTGGTFRRTEEIFKLLNLQCLGKTRFNELQNENLFPVIHKHFILQQEDVFARLIASDGVDLIGDGRCDSPGHSAKYGTYTFMDIETGEVIDFMVIHVGQVTHSNNMEKFGFVKLLDKFDETGIKIKSITTDRHVQIRAYMKKQRRDISHQFDIWHVSKSIKKKLFKAAKQKDCDKLNGWIKSIINHFWWCCATCDKSVLILKAKWKSILYHIQDKHSWEDDEGVPKSCEHAPVDKNSETTSDWIHEGTPAYSKLESIVLNKNLMKDLAFLVEFRHTGSLEVYHSLITKYCPKRLHFKLASMIARSELAALDHNNGLSRGQACTKDGKLRYNTVFPKQISDWRARPIYNKKDKTYLSHMLESVIQVHLDKEKLTSPTIPKDIPKNLSRDAPRPSKDELIAQLRVRFGKKDQ